MTVFLSMGWKRLENLGVVCNFHDLTNQPTYTHQSSINNNNNHNNNNNKKKKTTTTNQLTNS